MNGAGDGGDSADGGAPEADGQFDNLEFPSMADPLLSAQAFLLVGVTCKRKKPLQEVDFQEFQGFPFTRSEPVELAIPEISNTFIKLAFVAKGLTAAIPRTMAYPYAHPDEDEVMALLESAGERKRKVTLNQAPSSLFLEGSYDILVSMDGFAPMRLVGGFHPYRTFAWIVSELDARGLEAELEGGTVPSLPSPMAVATARAAAQFEALQKYKDGGKEYQARYNEDVLDNWRRAIQFGGRTGLALIHEALLNDPVACEKYRGRIEHMASIIQPYLALGETHRRCFVLLTRGTVMSAATVFTLTGMGRLALDKQLREQFGLEHVNVGWTGHLSTSTSPATEPPLLECIRELNAHNALVVSEQDFVGQNPQPGLLAVPFSVAGSDIDRVETAIASNEPLRVELIATREFKAAAAPELVRAMAAVARVGFQVQGEEAAALWSRVNRLEHASEIQVGIERVKEKSSKTPAAYSCTVAVASDGQPDAFMVRTAMPALLVGSLYVLAQQLQAKINVNADKVTGRQEVSRARAKVRNEFASQIEFRRGSPLYSFDTWGEIGALELSSAGIALQEELEKRTYGVVAGSAEGKELKNWLEGALQIHPDFAAGTATLARLWIDAGESGIGEMLDRQILRMEELIPPTFNKRMPKPAGDNATYQELLTLRFEVFRTEGRVGEAIEVARKLDKLEEHLPFVRPLAGQLLISQGAYQEAAQMCDREDRFIPMGQLVKGFALFAAGDQAGFREGVLECLFRWPPVRALVDNSIAASDEGRYMVMNWQYVEDIARPILESLPGLRDALKDLLALQSVQTAVAFLNDVFEQQEAFQRSQKGVRPLPWAKTVSEYAAALGGSPDFCWSDGERKDAST
jgi:hypothetical protein